MPGAFIRTVHKLCAFLASCVCATGALAESLISFTGTNALSTYAFLSDEDVNWVVAWSQSSSSNNVTLSAVLTSLVGSTTGNWYVTTAIGPTATGADVVYSGSYSPAILGFADNNFDTAPRTLLGSGLHFDPGTYYLVLDGPPGTYLNNAQWLGGRYPTITLAPGFSIGNYYSASSSSGWGDPAIPLNPFAPANSFKQWVPWSLGTMLVFEMESVDRAVPLPSTLPLAAMGLLALSLTRRRGVPALQH